MRDVALGSTEYFKFTTRSFSTGAPTTLAGTPVVSVYEENNLVQITSGVTLTVDYDSVTGLNDVSVVASSGNGYETGKSYYLVITTGTVGGVSVVGEVVGEFSIENQWNEVDVTSWNGTIVAVPTVAGVPEVDVTHWLGSAAATPTIAGIPEVDVTHFGGVAGTFSAGRAEVNTSHWAGTLTTLSATTTKPEVDVFSVSDDSTAANTLELQFDGTGIVGDTYPSTQSQLSGIANVGSAVHKSADSYTLTTGTQTGGTFATTEELDNIYHIHTDSAGAIELYYEFIIGAGIPSSVQMTGYLTNVNDVVDIYGYDWVSMSWKQIGSLNGTATSSTVQVNSYDMFINMVGTGANFGKVRVRFFKASGLTTATLGIDQIFVAFSRSQGGYQDAAIWFDSNASNTNTVLGVDGTSSNPVSSEAAVNTLLAAGNYVKVQVRPESTITFATSHTDQEWTGTSWTLNLGGQDLSGSSVYGAIVNGTATGSTEIKFNDCNLGTCTLPPFYASDCRLSSTITFSGAGDYIFNSCRSRIAGGSTPVIDTGAAVANVNLAMPEYWNGIEIRNLNAAGTDDFSISGTGQIIYAASSSGTVHQRGMWRVTNNGGVTIVTDDVTSNTHELWDSMILQSATVATLTSQTVFTLSDGSTDDDAYIGATVVVVDAITGEQKAFGSASGYVGSTKELTLAQDPGIFTIAVGDKVYILTSDAFTIFDKSLIGSTHNVPNSLGKRIRDLQEFGTYEGGAVFIDTINGAAGTTDYESGTNLNPVDTITDANTIAASLTLSRFEVAPQSSITFVASQINQVFNGIAYTIALGGQDISNTEFVGAQQISGTATTLTGEAHFVNCELVTGTLGQSHFKFCGMQGTITLSAAADYTMSDCYNQTSSSVSVDFGAAVGNTNLSVRRWSGVMEVQNYGTTGTDTMRIDGDGELILNANCTAGTIYVSGNMTIVDNAGGAVTISDDARYDVTQINDQVIDVIKTDTSTLPGQIAPTATPTIEEMITFLYKAWRNQSVQTATTYDLYNDAGTVVDQTATVAAGSTTFTKNKVGSGP